MLYHFGGAEELNKLKVDLRIDLDVALTFVHIARQTNERAKAMRNQQNARKAYDAVSYYLGTASLSRFEHENIMRKLAILKSALLSMGELF
jgi:hypothetical protein